MENNKSKGILVSDTELVDILDRYEFLIMSLNTQISPVLNKIHLINKEIKNLDSLFSKIKNTEESLNKANQKIEISINQILSQKIDKAVKIKIDEKSKNLDEIIQKQNQKIYKKESFFIAISFLFLGILIGFFL
jgi:chromosome segregation ATPase